MAFTPSSIDAIVGGQACSNLHMCLCVEENKKGRAKRELPHRDQSSVIIIIIPRPLKTGPFTPSFFAKPFNGPKIQTHSVASSVETTSSKDFNHLTL